MVKAASRIFFIPPVILFRRAQEYLMAQVTWVEHAEYEETGVHPLYRPLLRSGMALGAQRWVATLQRQCECLAVLMSSVLSNRELPSTKPSMTDLMMALRCDNV